MSIIKQNRLVRALLLALLCFAFFGLMDGTTAKADDPDPATATARVIYANNVELAPDNGQVIATANTNYSFDQGENYYPYAVYVTSDAASGPAITINTVTLGVDSTIIKIWDNNCGVTVETHDGGYVDKYSLVLTGPDSYIDVGWSHFNRGVCDAAIYRGADDAGAIANYFNNNFRFFDEETNDGFMLPANYWNDESVTMGYDAEIAEQNTEDPHYGKTVYNVTWNMEVTNLILRDNVVLFVQDEGMIRISGSLTIGNGSYIEPIDDNLRLEIQNPDAGISGMYLYDYFGQSGSTPLTSGSFEGTYYYTTQEINGNDTAIWTKNSSNDPTYNYGNPEVKTVAKKYIYAYNLVDFDGDGDSENDDLTLALASELLVKFRDMYGPFGFRTYYNPDRESMWHSVFDDALAMRDRIVVDFEHPQTITATRANGTTESIDRYTAMVDWGVSKTGEVIKDTVYLYKLPSMLDLLICTDFDESTGTGSKYYLRKAFDDKKVLVGEENADPQYIDEDYYTSVIIDDSYTNIVAGGHGVSMYDKNKDENMFTFQTVSYSYMKFRPSANEEFEIINPDTFVKVFKSTGKFFATASEGTGKRYDFVSHDATGKAADKIWEAGGQYPVKLFIHDTILHIMPLNSNAGAVAKDLKEVRLKDSLPEGAVTIDNSDTSDIVITFNSKFYDSVNFELVYADDSTGAFTVDREGIIIQYSGLGGNREDPNDPDWGRYWLDIYGEGEGNELNYTYDINTENFVVMATYYHSSAETGANNLRLVVTYDDGATEIIDSKDEAHNFSGYKSGSEYVEDGKAAVDTTTFIIGFMKVEGNNFTFSKNGHTGGLSVQVVNPGFDDASSFGGALAGSGKGKAWTGTGSLSY